jgi:hypothetical protein
MAIVDTDCPDPDEFGETLVFAVCKNCDYGINEHTEGECDCKTRRCEATVIKGGEPALCDRLLDDRGYCGYERSHVDA